MKKILAILSTLTFAPMIGTSIASCGISIGSDLPWDDGDENNHEEETITIITEDSENLTIMPKSENGWIDYFKIYNSEAKINKNEWQQLEDDKWDPNDPQDVKFKRWFQDESKIHEYWYSLIANFALTKATLFEKQIDDNFNWDSIANEENLDYLIKLFNTLIMLKTYDLAFSFFYQTEYKGFVLENDDIWEGNTGEQTKSQVNWQRVVDSLKIYQTEKEKWLAKVIATILIVKPLFDFNQFIILDYKGEMNKNDSQTFQILNKDDYQEITLEYEKNDEYEINLDQSQGLVKIDTKITSDIKEINFVLKGTVSKIQNTKKEIKIKIIEDKEI